jgi:hypothetical protein
MGFPGFSEWIPSEIQRYGALLGSSPGVLDRFSGVLRVDRGVSLALLNLSLNHHPTSYSRSPGFLADLWPSGAPGGLREPWDGLRFEK